jgi:hypothetical protein
MKNVNFYSVIIPIFLIALILQTSNLKADDWKQNVSSIKQPMAGKSIESLPEPISDVQSSRKRSEIVQTPSLPATISSIFSVTTTEDTGLGSLRKAITDANNSAGLDVIQFNIPVSGVCTLMPQSPLPGISDPVIIDGTTQSGYTGMPLIAIDGRNAGNAIGLNISAGNSTIKALIIAGFHGSGIVLWNGGGNTIEGSFIGIDATGMYDGGNWGSGIAILSPNNKIGNANGAINVISANDKGGIFISGASAIGNKIVHSNIGTSVNGTIAIGNSLAGIYILSSSSDTIGGVLPGERNIISGNYQSGISIRGQSTQSILIQGNYIGTESNGSLALGNLNGIEILPEVDSTGTPSYITIGGSTSAAMNLISGNVSAGIALFPDGTGGVGNIIIGNLIGTDSNGTAKVPNALGGIFVKKLTSNDAGILIGGANADSANIISGNNQHGIWMRGSGTKNNFIRGNYIGTSKKSLSGISALENQYAGIFLDNSPANMIGGDTPVAGNVIGSNGDEGISIIGDTANGNSIRNNWIGTDPEDIVNLGNQGHGIYIEASQTVVGGDVNSTNIIAHNRNRGIFIFDGTKNTIRFNSIHDNDSLGIDLSPERLTPNDQKDVDLGTNNLQNFPLLDSASLSANSIHIKGRFDSEPDTTYIIDFFKNKTRNASHFGEGEKYIGSVTVQCDTGGRKDLDVTLPVHISDDEFITATATDPQGNTSEFSRALCLKDSDGDGIFDCWESPGDGIDVNADGVIDLDLYAKGARPDHKDIFVEVDYMFGFTPADSTLPLVQNAFAKIKNKYVNNPDNKDGINLHAELNAADLPISDSTWTSNWWQKFFETKKQFFGTDLERVNSNAANILEAKRLVYRYCIFADRQGVDGSSGRGELNNGAGGNDFMVTLGAFPKINDTIQATTFMHELGHTLGLHHGGGDDKNFKPNYYSIMNYTWQLPQTSEYYGGLGWALNYSPVALPTLNENNLKESIGLNPQPGDFPLVIVPYNSNANLKSTGLLYPGVAIDWDGNGDSTGNALVPVDINYVDEDPPNVPSPGDVLSGYADWPNLKYNFRGSSEFRDPTVSQYSAMAEHKTTEPEEMTPQIYKYLQSLPPYGIIPLYRVPRLAPSGADSVLVGGNWGTLLIIIDVPNPLGDATFHIVSSDTSIAVADSVVVIGQGNTERAFNIETKSVPTDTVVTISVTNADVPISIKITVKAASMIAFTTDAPGAPRNCTIANEFGVQHRFMSGKNISFQCQLDGPAPSAGGVLHLTSSDRSVLAPDSVVIIPPQASKIDIPLTPLSAEAHGLVVIMAEYRGAIFSDTVDVIDGPHYSLVDLGPPGSISSRAWKINKKGQVLISSTDTLGLKNFFIWHDGQFDRLDSSVGFRLVSVSDMNDSGWVVGIYAPNPDDLLDPRAVLQAGIWKNGLTTVFYDSLATQAMSKALRINNKGTVLGYSYIYSSANNPIFNEHAWLWNNDTITYLGIPPSGRPFNVGFGVNDFDAVTGMSFDDDYTWGATNIHGFVWKNSVFTMEDGNWFIAQAINNSDVVAGIWNDGGWFRYNNGGIKLFQPNIGTAGIGEISAINETGDVAGDWYDSFSNYPRTGFAYIDGWQYACDCLTDLPPLWYRLHRAQSINNKKQIVGYGNYNHLEEDHETQWAYMLNPASGQTDVQVDPRSTIPSWYGLSQNYPNPFNPSTTIDYQLPTQSHVTLKVFDVLGREVATLVNENKNSGNYEVDFDGSKLPSGVYFYRLSAGSFIEIKKLLLLK